jgi:hypothetical protein
MKKLLMSLLLAGAVGAPAYAAAPSGSTGECKDGSYTSADSKRGACSGHGGVKDWYGKEKAAKRNDKSEAKAEARNEARKESKEERPKSEPQAKAPNDATGKCADGSYTSADNRQGACASHGGIKDWYAKEAQTSAAGGSSGRVWVNSSSRVYHCSGDRWYGKTEKGEYMSEAAAKAKGNRPDHGQACSER